MKRSHVIPMLAILGDWLIIAGSIAAAELTNSWFIKVLAIVVIGTRQHALFAMVHEAVHMHIAQSKRINDAISNVFCALPLLFDTEVYRKNHLQHHRSLNTEQDPDWVRKVGKKEWTFPVTPREAIMFVPYYVFLRGPMEWGYILWRFSGFGEKARWRGEAPFLLFKVVYFTTAVAAFWHFHVVQASLLYWFTPMFFALPLIGRIRSIAEHFAISYTDVYNSTRDVNAGWFERFLYSPHNVNFHLTHHLYPHVPFYRLPEAHRIFSQSSESKGAHINASYLFPFRHSVLRDVLQGRPKEQSRDKAA